MKSRARSQPATNPSSAVAGTSNRLISTTGEACPSNGHYPLLMNDVPYIHTHPPVRPVAPHRPLPRELPCLAAHAANHHHLRGKAPGPSDPGHLGEAALGLRVLEQA